MADMALAMSIGDPLPAVASPDFSRRKTAAGKDISSNWSKIQCFPVGFLKVPHHILPVSLRMYSFLSSSFSIYTLSSGHHGLNKI